jgi:hypothetical protein
MSALIDLTGQRFGRLAILDRVDPLRRSREAWWQCRCDCGNTKITTSRYLRTGITTSCGCLVNELRAGLAYRNTTHGEAGNLTPEYRAWTGMKDRCYNPNSMKYHLYGGRGIRVYEGWRRSFETFLADVGRRPSADHSLDRFPDGDGNYEPGNVRWATYSEQNSNRRTYTRRRKAT